MQKVDDYNLVALYQSSPTDFETYLEGFLIPSIAQFEKYNFSVLSDRNDTTKQFNQDLTIVEKNILALLMSQEWYRKELDTVDEWARLLDKDFKSTSPAMTQREKRERFATSREEVSQMIVQYDIDNNFSDLEQALGV